MDFKINLDKKRPEIDDLQIQALKTRYAKAEMSDREYDSDGRIMIEFKDSNRYLDMMERNVTEIKDLEEKLEKFRKDNARINNEYAETKKKEEKNKGKKDKKKKKKSNLELIRSVFNSAPIIKDDSSDDEDQPEGGTYTPSKKKNTDGKITKKTEVEDVIQDERYPRRFAPIMATVLEVSQEIDVIKDLIMEDMNKPGGTRMYKAQQFANLISLNNGKLSCAKELHNIGKTMSTLELKQESKNDKEDDGAKVLNSIGLRIIRGEYDDDEKVASRKKDKKDKKKKRHNDEDEDWKDKKSKSDHDLATSFAENINRGTTELTNYEKHIHWEGKYIIGVVVEDGDEDEWKFVALDPKNHKRIKDFPKDLIPKRKKVELKFDYSKGRAVDKLTKHPYPLLVK